MSNEKTVNVIPNGDTLVIREGEAPQVFTYEGFKYTADSTDSLITLVQSKGSNSNSVIAYNERGINVILDDTVKDREQDRLSYCYKHSIQYQEWKRILEGQAFEQKGFIDFLKRREPNEVADVDVLLAAIQQFKYVTNITGDFTYDDRNNYTFAIKVGDAEGTVRLPQLIYANIEVFNESGFTQVLELEMEVKKPKGENEKPLFGLHCPKLARYLQDAVAYEVDKVKKELDGYLIVAGSI